MPVSRRSNSRYSKMPRHRDSDAGFRLRPGAADDQLFSTLDWDWSKFQPRIEVQDKRSRQVAFGRITEGVSKAAVE